MDLNSAFGLLAISRSRTSLQRGPRPGRDTTEAGPAWSIKDDAGGSSIAERNRRIRKEQVNDKAREQARDNYRDEARAEITDTLRDEGETGRSPLTQDQREKRDTMLQLRLDQYDSRKDIQKREEDKARKEIDKGRQAAGTDPDARREAEDAVDKIIADEFDQTNDAFSDDAEGFGEDSFISDRTESKYAEDVSEDEPPDLSGEDTPEENLTLAALAVAVGNIDKQLQIHVSNTDIHSYG
jgi:hypothetical protein